MSTRSIRQRGFVKDVLAVVLGLVVPIVLILGGYYLYQHAGEKDQPAPVQPAPVQESHSPAPAPPEEPPPPVANQPPSRPARQTAQAPEYPTRPVVKPFPGDPGDMYLKLPEQPVPSGSEFTIDLVMNGGDKVIAATTMYVHFDPLALEFKKCVGSLTQGSKSPLATNMVSAGNLVISDINTPQRTQPGVSPYNEDMTGPVTVYRLTFLAAAEPGEHTFIGGGSTTFHDPGDLPNEGSRPPTAIGDAPFPRTAAASAAEIVIGE
jgi:hypothetical protein